MSKKSKKFKIEKKAVKNAAKKAGKKAAKTRRSIDRMPQRNFRRFRRDRDRDEGREQRPEAAFTLEDGRLIFRNKPYPMATYFACDGTSNRWNDFCSRFN